MVVSLPDDILLLVMYSLPGKELARAGCVCRQWAVLAGRAWKVLFVRDFGVCKNRRCILDVHGYKHEWVWRRRHVAPWKMKTSIHMVLSFRVQDGKIAVGLSNGMIDLFVLDQNERPGELQAFHVHESSCLIMSLAFWSDTKVIAGDYNSEIYVWNICLGQLEATYSGHQGSVIFLDVDGSFMASGSEDMLIKLWDLDNETLIGSFHGHTSTVNCGKLIVANSQLLSGSADNTIKVWDIGKFECIRTITDHLQPVFCLTVFAGLVASGGEDTTARLFDIQTGHCLQVLRGNTGPVWDLDFDGNHLLTASGDTQVRMWDIDSGMCLRTWHHFQSVAGVGRTPSSLITCSYSGTLRVWNFH